MPSSGFAHILVEATSAPGRHMVYLQIGSYRLELEAPTAARAREIAWDILNSLGLGGARG